MSTDSVYKIIYNLWLYGIINYIRRVFLIEDKKLTLYDKNEIIERISGMLKYYGDCKYKKEVIKAA